MKKAEDIVNEISEFGTANQSFWYVSTNKCLEGIKAAQIDAIETTVKRCAEEAKMSHKYYPKEGKGNYKKYCEFKGSYPERYDSYGESIGVDVFQVNQTSILQVAEELKKELE